MEKTILFRSIVLLAAFLLLGGCLQQTATEQQKNTTLLSSNREPGIQECRVEYFDTRDSATVYFIGVASDADGVVVYYSWNLTDGFMTNDQSFVHTFPRPGVYYAHLTVVDDRGATNTTTIPVYIYDSSNVHQQSDTKRLIGQWRNNEGTSIQFTEQGEFGIVGGPATKRYWLSAGALYIQNESKQTVRYEYYFEGSDALTFFPSGQTSTSQDRWMRVQY